MAYLKAVSGCMLASLPLSLRLRGKSTTQSHWTPIYYVDLTTPAGITLEQAIEQATVDDDRRKQLGFHQWALDEAAREGYAAGAFEESEEEGASVVEEFYPETQHDEAPSKAASKSTSGDRLGRRIAQAGGEIKV